MYVPTSPRDQGFTSKVFGFTGRRRGLPGNEANMVTLCPEHWVRLPQVPSGAERGTFSIPALSQLGEKRYMQCSVNIYPGRACSCVWAALGCHCPGSPSNFSSHCMVGRCPPGSYDGSRKHLYFQPYLAGMTKKNWQSPELWWALSILMPLSKSYSSHLNFLLS